MKITVRWKISSALMLFVALMGIINAESTLCPKNCESVTGCNDADRGCSECKEGWYGRQCNYPMECRIGRGGTYTGRMSKTENNISCQLWSLQTPHSHYWSSLGDQKNYCRNPTPHFANSKPWCYQLRGWRYGYCDVPECNKHCPAPRLLVFGDVINPPSSGFLKGFIVEVIAGGCGPGKHGKMICQDDLTWSMPLECSLMPGWCMKPNITEPSYITDGRNDFYYQDIIVILCRAGYEILGSNQILCQEDKSWSTIPECSRTACEDPALKPDSFISTKFKTPYVFEDEITIKCNKGFAIIGKNKFKCLVNKKWNGEMPSCKVVTCSDSHLPNNLMILGGYKTEYEYLDTVTLGCRGNSKFNGTNTTTCLHTGKWLEINAHCIEYPDHQYPEEKSNVGQLDGVSTFAKSVLGVVVGIGIIAVIVIIYLRKRRDNNGKECGKIPLHSTQMNGNTPTGTSANEYPNSVAIGEEEGINVQDDGDCVYYNVANKSLKIEDLADYVKKKKQTDFFKNEFSKFKTGLQRSTDEACKPKNRTKNRYKHIYPYDDNRIILQTVHSVPESDYINASPIKGYDGNTKYIAAQGPKKATVIDFWRMIWEQNCCGIVMLTNISEEGKKKCEHYWPDEGTIQMDAITVEHCNTDMYADFTIRQLTISKGDSTRQIYHFHFTAWPDKGVPSCVYSLAQFRMKVFSTHRDKDGPVTVHCSAGIGRTGTFIALDYLVDQTKATGSVDAFSCVKRLRDQRVNMVQTKEQYIYLHSVLVEDYDWNVLRILSSEFIARYKQLQIVNPATRRTGLEDRYKELEKSSPVLPLEEFKGSKRPGVKDKNRYSNILPADSYRPVLTRSGKENGDYINAVNLPSYRNKTAFIATQMPLPNTVVDFWTLIYDQDVSIIVRLNQTVDESCGVYWAQGTDKRFGPFTVSFVSDQRDGNIAVRTLKIKRQSEQPRIVKQFMMTDWPDNAFVPASPSSLLHLMDKMQTRVSGKQGTPVIVHCMNGADKCGLFCTVVAIIDRLKVEQDVVIQQIITQMRSRRPQFIPNKEQFQFCFESVNQYIQRFKTYSNFV